MRVKDMTKVTSFGNYQKNHLAQKGSQTLGIRTSLPSPHKHKGCMWGLSCHACATCCHCSRAVHNTQHAEGHCVTCCCFAQCLTVLVYGERSVHEVSTGSLQCHKPPHQLKCSSSNIKVKDALVHTRVFTVPNQLDLHPATGQQRTMQEYRHGRTLAH